MNLNLEHRSFCNKDNEKWIYFGNSYLKLFRLEEKIKKNRLSISRQTSINYSNEKKYFIDWLEKQRVYFDDSIDWWMNSFASKTNLTSNFLLNISSIKSIKEYLKNNKEKSKITIVSENYHLLKFLVKNLEKDYKIKTPKFFSFFLLLEKILLIFNGFINYLKIIYYFIINYFYSLLSKTSQKHLPESEVYLFHDLINNSNFKNGIVQSRYYGNYSSWLENQGKQVISLPWFYQNIKNKKKLYKSLRERKSFIPEDWLNLSDYFRCIYRSLKSNFTIHEKINYTGCNIQPLISYYKLLGLTTTRSAIYYRYFPAVKKWSKKVNKIIFFDHYQNQMYENSARYCINSLSEKSIKSIGYYHSLHSNEFLPYLTNYKEWKSKVKPDTIICPNELCKNHLEFLGTPKEKIKIISDLQRSELKIKETNKNEKQLLVILSLFPEVNYEILFKLSKINSFISNELGIKIKLRPHPYININELIDNLGWKYFPKNWIISEENLETDLNNCYCAITMNSAIITDLILFDCIAIILKSELNTGENYLDFIEKKFPIINNTEEKNLKSKLQEVFFTKKNYFKEEFSNIKKFIESDINKNNYHKIAE